MSPTAVSADDLPNARAMLEEIVPVIGVIPAAGPPAILLAGPWILFALVIAGPAALLVMGAIILLAAGLLIAALAALAAAPYLLVRHLRCAWAHHSASRAPLYARLQDARPAERDLHPHDLRGAHA
jgi:hypothetical protein